MAATPLSVSVVTDALKELYPEARNLNKAVYRKSPFLAAIRKDTKKLKSKSCVVPFRYARPQGASATFATGRTNMRPSAYARVAVTGKNYYGFAQIDGEAIDRADGDPGSFAQEIKDEVDGTIYTVGRALARFCFGNGGGSLGKISAASNPATPTITLDQPADIRWFEKGMVLAVSADDGTGGGGVRTGTVEVSKVDRGLGTITATGNWTAGIAAAVAGDFIFREGDYAGVLSGYEAWVPRSAPSATAFFGLDRTPDSRLYGVRADYSGVPIEEGLKRGAELLTREGSDVDFACVSTVDFVELELALGDKVRYSTMQAYDDASIGFETISITLAGKKVRIMADADMPVNRCFMGQLDTWTLGSMGELIKLLDNDGNAVLRTGTTDGVELQIVSRSQLWCDMPGWNGNFAIGS